ncbi:MAG: hypothetical protein H6833_05540 [Planctomycetes bacterium]|nr:hypothetical protein [Planctomycetota bacterium]
MARDAADEDIHGFVEARLVDDVGARQEAHAGARATIKWRPICAQGANDES